ncbi:nucleotidyltransferase domain-containing protein [Inmirania thermothiophila]|uniref:Putative nucleotidyltransferase-like protein n=1 Tax=Inmirania thermothiophila TaxID=1750597 RepID=A0A3N1XSM1_9GAMM|nr:nucleotidyltransferase family protein [Inmirania thermothiophila]ROR29645.1 putative nucleotidyltransferase-like protein [Inmirania thermothiophila]
MPATVPRRAPEPVHARLAAGLLEPAALAGLRLADWDALLPAARAAGLLATLAERVAAAGLVERVPARARRHLEAARRFAAAQARAADDELHRLATLLGRRGIEPVLLKGAAYLAAGLPCAEGRLMGDIDLLVPETRLAEAELALKLAGWAPVKHDPYDQRYYRRWMHEIPPLRHVHRGSSIDLHHNILPRTSRARPQGAALLEAAVAVPGRPGLRVLAPADMVLHAAAHRFFDDGECDHALRDLWDLHLLLGAFGGEPGFWDTLAARAAAFGLERPLAYALRWCRRRFGTAVPAGTLAAVAAHLPPPPLGRIMDAVWERALRPPHAACDDAWSGLARRAVYLRGHWLRMPPRLLLPHLARKALVPRRA